MNWAITSTEFYSFFMFLVTFLPIMIFRFGGLITRPQKVQCISLRLRSIAFRSCDASSWPSHWLHSSSNFSLTSSTFIESIYSFCRCLFSSLSFSLDRSISLFVDSISFLFICEKAWSLALFSKFFVLIEAAEIWPYILARTAPSMSWSDLKVLFRNWYW